MVSKRKMLKNRWIKRVAALLAVGLIFTAGWAGGAGYLHPTKDQANTQLPANLDYSSVNEVYQLLKTNYDGSLDQTKLLDGLKTGLVNAAGNPYTEYMSPKDYKAFNSQLDGTFSGIGAELSLNTQNQITVISPISGFPADKAGLKTKDIITAINSKTTTGMGLSAAVDNIRGPKGTDVTLTIVRAGEDHTIDLKITRNDITIPSVTSKVENGIGYLKISRFGEDTTQLAQTAAQSFKSQNVKGVILDMRDDPGGLLDAAVGVSSLWLPSGKTVLTERRNGIIINSYTADGQSPLQGIPTVVLVNGGSASASEITAGALKDNNVATLVGVKSYGKGSVQQVLKLKNGGALKVTIARWYTPNGKNIDKAGITPDKVVELTSDQIKAGQDPQKDAARATLGQ
jgi:carboxyl-terminal processing protease